MAHGVEGGEIKTNNVTQVGSPVGDGATGLKVGDFVSDTWGQKYFCLLRLRNCLPTFKTMPAPLLTIRSLTCSGQN